MSQTRSVGRARWSGATAAAWVLGLLAATTAALTAGRAQAQSTWTATADGVWSDPLNWNGGAGPAPVSGAAQLIFGASGTTTYVATNDLGAFTLNSLTFANTGTGTVTAAGAELTFAGAGATLASTGSGPASLAADAVFSAATTVTNSGSGLFSLDGKSTFGSGSATTFGGAGGVTFGATSQVLLQDTVTLTNTGAGNLVFTDGVTYTGTNVTLNLANTGAGLFTLGNMAAVSGTMNVTAGTVKFAGATGGDLFGDALFLNIAAGATYDFANNGEQFGGLSGAGNIVLGSAGMTFNAAGDRTWTGTISGTGAVTQNNAGTWTLGGTNTYSGTTTVQGGGTIRAAAANVFSPASPVAVAAGTGVLDTGGFSQTMAGISGGGPGAVLQVDAGNTLTLNGSGTGFRLFNGSVGGAGNLTIGGTAVQAFFGTNTYTGATTINGGTLRVALASLQSTSGVTLNGGALDVVTTADAAFPASLAGTGALLKGGAGALTLSAAGPTLSSLTVYGGGLVLDHSASNAAKVGPNPALVLASGRLSVLGNGAAATAQSFNNTTLAGGGHVLVTAGNNQNASVALGALTRAAGSTLNVALADTGSGAASVTTTAQNGATGIVGGWATVNGAGWATTGTGAGPFAVAPLAPGAYTVDAWTAGAHVDLTSNFTVPAAAAVASVRFAAPGAATLTLAGTNSLATGGLLVTPGVGANNTTVTAGTLTAPAGQELFVHQFNSAGTLTIASVVGNTASVTNQAGNQTTGNATITGLTSTAGLIPGMRVSGTGIAANARILSVNSPTSVTLTANATTTAAGNSLTFTGGTALVKSGPGTLVLTNTTNNFLGPLVLNEGVVSVGAARALGPSGTTTSNSVYLNGGTYQATGTYDPGSGTAPFIFGPGGGTIDVSAANLTFTRQGNTLFGSGTLTKTGPGKLSIGSNASAFNGQFVVAGGTVRFQSNQFQNAAAGTVLPGGQYEINDDAAAGTFRLATTAVMNLSGAGPAGSAVPGAFVLTDQSPNGAVPGGPGTNFTTAVQLTGDATVGVYNGNNGRVSTLNFTNQVGGSGNLLKTGDGVLVLHSALNNYSGATIVSNGTLRINGGPNRLPAGTTLQFGETGSTNNGTFDLNGQNQTVAGLLTAGSATGHQVVNGGAGTPTLTVNYAGGTPQTYAGAVGGTSPDLNFVKAGAGTLTLSGPTTYTGSTAVNGGTLRVFSNTVGRPYTVADGATLAVVNTNPAVPFSMSALTLGTAGPTALGFELAAGAPVDGFITVTDGGGLATHGAVNVAVTSAQTLSVGQFPLIKYAGAIGGDAFAAFAAGTLSLPSRVSGSLVNNAANFSVDLNVTAVDFIKWTGSVAGGVWDINGAQNWKLASSGTPTTYLESPAPGDRVVFDETAPGTRTVALATTLTPSAVTVSGPADYTLAGAGKLSGATGLTKTGTGTLTVLTDNVNTGTTTVSGGTLRVGNGGAAGALGPGDLVNNAAIVFDRSDDVAFAANLSGTGSLTKNGAGTLSLTGGLALTGNTLINAGTLALSGGTYPGNVTGAGALAKTGVGTLTLTGTASHNGGTTVIGGILQVGDGGTSGAVGGAVTLAAGTQLTFNRSDDSASAAAIGGAGAVRKEGAGKTTLTGALTYTGDTFVNAGTLEFASASDVTLSGKLGGVATSTVTKSGAGTLTLLNANSGFVGTFVIDAGTVVLDDQGAGGDLNASSLVINPGGKFVFGPTQGSNPDMAEGNNGLFMTINGGTFEHRIGEVWSALRLQNNGTFRFNGFGGGVGSTANATSGPFLGYQLESGTIVAENVGAGTGTLTGNVEKKTAGIVSFQGRTAIAAASTITITEGVLAFEAGNVPGTGAGTVTLGDGTTTGVFRMVGAGAATLGRPLAVNTGAIDVADPAGTLTLTATVTGSGPLAKTGPGTLAVPGPDGAYTGTLSLQGGTLRSGPGVAPGGPVAVSNGATLAVTSGASPATLTLSTLSLAASGSTLRFEIDTATTPAVPLLAVSTADGLTVAAGTHVLSVSSPQPLPVGQFTLIDYAGAPISSGFTLGSIGSRTSGGLVYNTANTSIDLNVTGSDTTLWTGNLSATWDVGSAPDVGGTNNFKLASTSAPTNFFTGDRVTFNDTAAGFTVSLAAAVQPGSVTVDNSLNTYTFQGAGSITGPTTLVKQGTGTLVLTTDNTYTGATTVSGGTLQVGNGGTTGSIAGNVAVAAGATLAFNRSDDLAYPALLSGDGTVTKAGAGTLTLGAANAAFIGTLVVDGGTLALEDSGGGADVNAVSIVVNNGATFVFGANGNPDLPNTTVVTVNAGGLFDMRQGEVFGGLVLKGGTFKMSGTTLAGISPTTQGPLGYVLESGAITAEFSGTANGGALSGTTFIDKTTAGTVTLGAGVTIADAISVNVKEGVLALGGGSFPASGTTTVTLGDAATAGTLRLTDLGAVSSARPFAVATGGGTLDVATAGASLTLTGTLTGDGPLAKAGAGTLVLPGTAALTGPISVTGGALRVSGSVADSAGVTVAPAATFQADATQTLKALAVADGAAAEVTAGPAVKVLTLKAMPTLNATGKLDLRRNALIVDDATTDQSAAVVAQILKGFNPSAPLAGDGTWNGNKGITSADAQATAASPTPLAVGWARASDLLGISGAQTGTWLGQSGITPTATLVRTTISGDVDLSGDVGFADLLKVAQNYDQTGPAIVWFSGDINFDQTVGFADLLAVAQNYDKTLTLPAEVPGASADFNADWQAALAQVPEPGALSLLAAGALALLRRGRAAAPRARRALQASRVG